MTETERWVHQACEGIVASGQVRLYRDLYKDLRERLPCGVACLLIRSGLTRTRVAYLPAGGQPSWRVVLARATAIAALRRLERWAEQRDYREKGWGMRGF